jgi:hypothetical protein
LHRWKVEPPHDESNAIVGNLAKDIKGVPKFDNLYGCRESLFDGIKRATDVMVAGGHHGRVQAHVSEPHVASRSPASTGSRKAFAAVVTSSRVGQSS